MNNKFITYTGLTGVLIGAGLIAFGYYQTQPLLLYIGVGCVIVFVFYILILQSVNLFIQDKRLDIEKLEKQGFTITECPYCQKQNIKEDIYCIYCGELLGEQNGETKT